MAGTASETPSKATTESKAITGVATDLTFNDQLACLPTEYPESSLENMRALGVTDLGAGLVSMDVNKNEGELEIVWQADGKLDNTGPSVSYGATLAGELEDGSSYFYLILVKFMDGALRITELMDGNGNTERNVMSVDTTQDSVRFLAPSHLVPGIGPSTRITGDISRDGFQVSSCE